MSLEKKLILGKEKRGPGCSRGEKGDPEYDDVELSVQGTSTVTFW